MRTLIILLSSISIAQTKLIELVRHIKELSPYCAATLFDHSFSILERSHCWSYFCGRSSKNMFGSRDSWRDHLKRLAGVSMNSPSTSTYLELLRWLTTYSSSP